MLDKKIPLFKRADADASIGVFFDGFSKVIVAIAILIGTLGLSGKIVFGTMMPGVVVGGLLCNGGLWLYYRRMAKKANNPDLTAIPGGLQSGRIFIWLFSIMLPVYTQTENAMLAFQVGVFAHFLGGLVFIAGAFFVPKIMKVIPAAALFGAVAGGALAFLALQSFDSLLKMPIVGWTAFIVLFLLYLGKIETKVPAAFIAIIIGSAIAWLTGNMDVTAIADSFGNLSFQLPKVTLGMFDAEVISTAITYLPIIIVFSIGEVISGIQAVEQAIECGDKEFEAVRPLVITGAASAVSALFGNPLALGLYWGYPGWKQMKAGTGYHLGVAGLYAVVGLTGLTAIINAVIPEATVMPILIFIGVASFSQAFEIVEKKHFPAVAVALIPIIVDWIGGNVGEDVLVGFQGTLAGSAFIGMVWGAMMFYIIEHQWIKVAVSCLAGFLLSVAGMIHAPAVLFTETYVFPTEWVIIYIGTALVFTVFHLIKYRRNVEKEQNE